MVRKRLQAIPRRDATVSGILRDALWVHGHFSAPRLMLYLVFTAIMLVVGFLIWKDPIEGAKYILPYLIKTFATLMAYCFAIKGLRAWGSYMGDGYIDPTMEYQNTYDQQGSERIDDPDGGA